MLKFFQSDRLKALVNQIEKEELRCVLGVTILAEELSRRFSTNLLEGMKVHSAQCRAIQSTIVRDPNMEIIRPQVNRFLGWAIGSYRRRLQKDIACERASRERTERIPTVLKFLNTMRIFHERRIMDFLP